MESDKLEVELSEGEELALVLAASARSEAIHKADLAFQASVNKVFSRANKDKKPVLSFSRKDKLIFTIELGPNKIAEEASDGIKN